MIMTTMAAETWCKSIIYNTSEYIYIYIYIFTKLIDNICKYIVAKFVCVSF